MGFLNRLPHILEKFYLMRKKNQYSGISKNRIRDEKIKNYIKENYQKNKNFSLEDIKYLSFDLKNELNIIISTSELRCIITDPENKLSKKQKQQQEYREIIKNLQLKYKNGQIQGMDMFEMHKYIEFHFGIQLNSISVLMAICVNVYDGYADMNIFG